MFDRGLVHAGRTSFSLPAGNFAASGSGICRVIVNALMFLFYLNLLLTGLIYCSLANFGSNTPIPKLFTLHNRLYDRIEAIVIGY
jgi:hypothetical protein